MQRGLSVRVRTPGMGRSRRGRRRRAPPSHLPHPAMTTRAAQAERVRICQAPIKERVVLAETGYDIADLQEQERAVVQCFTGSGISLTLKL